jgi:DNA-binding transcriptional LysR family regulator
MLVHNIEISPVWESVSTQAIVKAVSRGLGISILPYLLVKQDLDEGNIEQVKIKDLSFHRFFNIIYHKNKFLTQSAKDFVEICKNQQYSS